MRFFVPLLMAISLAFAWQGAAFADNHDKNDAKAATESTADKGKDPADEKKKAKQDEECE